MIGDRQVSQLINKNYNNYLVNSSALKQPTSLWYTSTCYMSRDKHRSPGHRCLQQCFVVAVRLKVENTSASTFKDALMNHQTEQIPLATKPKEHFFWTLVRSIVKRVLHKCEWKWVSVEIHKVTLWKYDDELIIKIMINQNQTKINYRCTGTKKDILWLLLILMLIIDIDMTDI